jgi:hypothetical protein
VQHSHTAEGPNHAHHQGSTNFGEDGHHCRHEGGLRTALVVAEQQQQQQQQPLWQSERSWVKLLWCDVLHHWLAVGDLNPTGATTMKDRGMCFFCSFIVFYHVGCYGCNSAQHVS